MQIELALIAAAASFVGSWFAARLAFSRFTEEKLWERKVAAYSAIFEALHKIGRWYEKNLEAAMMDKELTDDYRAELANASGEAKNELELRIATEVWLIPKTCRERLHKMITELDECSFGYPNDWQGFLDAGSFIVKRAVDDLTRMVQADLKARRGWRLFMP